MDVHGYGQTWITLYLAYFSFQQAVHMIVAVIEDKM